MSEPHEDEEDLLYAVAGCLAAVAIVSTVGGQEGADAVKELRQLANELKQL
jgi:hypothetical protein